MPNTRHAADDIDAGKPEYAAFERYVSLIARKRTLSDELTDVEAALKALEPQLLAYLGEGGYEMVRLGGYTISPHREPWVYPKFGYSRNDVCRALKECGMGHYVQEQFNTRSLTKYVRDLEKEHNVLADEDGALPLILPPPLIAVLEIKPSYRIQAVRR
jgi:hypothetical protein